MQALSADVIQSRQNEPISIILDFFDNFKSNLGLNVGKMKTRPTESAECVMHLSCNVTMVAVINARHGGFLPAALLATP